MATATERDAWTAAKSKRDFRALARWLSRAEREPEAVAQLLQGEGKSLGRAPVYGLTGVPGAGKSTLISGLLRQYRAEGLTAAVLAVDPNSPFTGGALLGDRVRLAEHYNDSGIFIRSLGTRGALGGLSAAVRLAVDLCDAFGFDRILVETVGVGQTEVDIRFLADVTAVLLTPEWGDGIQAIKAGILEAGDLFVVNKVDRPGADRVVAALKEMLEFSERTDIPVLTCEAVRPESAVAVAKALSDRRAALGGMLQVRRAESDRMALQKLIEQRLRKDVLQWLEDSAPSTESRYEGYLRFLGEYAKQGLGVVANAQGKKKP